ncbi:PREDICTED: alpha-tocopherol transfer protein-like [Atta colombica]|uniref:alpha-tocopherol transfer protein-like n=1 Tax=Atta colombica TaxID=520822 RepID=UPI00084C9752|nr:PREDICTED: alpha-tocopherol transfer protein-like [Atta colombica]
MASNYSDSVVHTRQELTSDDKKYAAVHLNETDKIRKNAIAEIKRWIEECDDLRIQINKNDRGDFLILRFLRVCKFNLEKTKIRMQNYYKQRFCLPEWYMNKNPFRPELQELLDLGIILPLRKPDNHGRLVMIIYGTRHDPKKHKIADIAKIAVMMTEIAIKNYTTVSVYGCSLFLDVANPTIQHALQMRPQVIMNLVHGWQSSYPLRIQSINIINVNKYIDIILRMFRSFMIEKMKNRLHVYSQSAMQDCFKDIPANILPVEFGGTDDTLQELAGYWKKLLEENRDWLMDDEKNCY